MPTTQERPPEWINAAPIGIHRRTTVQAPAAALWDAIADTGSWTIWASAMRDCRWTSHEPHGVGSTRFVHMDAFKVNERITAWEPGNRWAMTVIDMNLGILTSLAEEITLHETNGRTTVDFRLGVELSRIGRILRRPLIAQQKKAIDLLLEELAQHVGVSQPITVEAGHSAI